MGAVCTAASSPTLAAPHGRAPGLPTAGGTVLGEAVLAQPRVEVEVGRGNWIACILRRHTSGFVGVCVCAFYTQERKRDGDMESRVMLQFETGRLRQPNREQESGGERPSGAVGGGGPALAELSCKCLLEIQAGQS